MTRRAKIALSKAEFRTIWRQIEEHERLYVPITEPAMNALRLSLNKKFITRYSTAKRSLEKRLTDSWQAYLDEHTIREDDVRATS